MKHPKILKSLIMAILLTSACIVIAASDAAADDIDWRKYMKSAAVVSSIAAAIALVDNCGKPLQIEETKDDGKIRLSFTCSGNEDEEGTAVIEFDDFGDGVLVPSKFDLAG